jgi:hypothetical protein
MMLADLLFIVLFLVAVATLLAAASFALRKQFGRARGILSKLFVGAAVYMLVLIAVSFMLPRRIVKLLVHRWL